MTATCLILVDSRGRASITWQIPTPPSATLNEVARMLDEMLTAHLRILHPLGTGHPRPHVPPMA